MLVIEWHYVATKWHYVLIEWHYDVNRMALCFIILLRQLVILRKKIN
ncbi:MAG: hypothetical protein LKE30_05965 [Bacteroidales bacterium]|jgi:hypothetical protein|nr:hypothetical protein [Bacteroidales bacterium]